MKTKISFSLIILIALITTGCAGEAQSTSSTTSAKTSSSTGTYFSINEVGLGPNGFVALTNFTDIPASLSGLYLCQGSDCFELPATLVDAEETVRISVANGEGIENAIATQASLGEINPSNGEIALMTSKKINDPQSVLAYFQWGSDPHDITETAIAAGLWVKGGYGPSSENAIRLFKVPETGLWLFEEP